MANIKIIDLPTGSPESTSFVEATQVDELAESGRSTVKLALNALGNYVAGQGASPLEYGDLETESTTLIGAANELHNTIGADAYDETATYNTGDYCIYGGELYKCNDDNVTGAWDATKWDATILVDELGGSGSSLVLPESIADEYDETASYTAGDFVMYQGILYKCNHISATGSFDPTKWDAISATDYINSVKSSLTTNINHLAADLSDAYSSSRTYAVGDLCILANTLYKCNTAITTPEAWTPAHWTATTIEALIASKQDLLTMQTGSGTFSVPVSDDSAIITKKWGAVFFANVTIKPVNDIITYHTELADMGALCPDQLARYSARGSAGNTCRLEISHGKLLSESKLFAGEYYTIAPVIM